MRINKQTTRRALCLSLLVPLFLSACRGGGTAPSTPAPDTTAPSVSSTTPAAAATGVARNSSITATFDEDIFAITVDAASFTLAASSTSNTTAGSVSFDGASNVATFSPNDPLGLLTTYTATLTTAITDLSGNALAADYGWSFTTADGAWGSAGQIESDSTGDARNPQIAINSSGNAIAVWRQSDGTRDNIWANRFNGSSWGTAELIETNDLGRAWRPQIAIDSSGNAIAVWHQFDGTRDNIWANRFDGSSWGTAELIETDNTGDAWVPQIAFDSSGNAIAVWAQYDGTRYNIWANRFDGSSWGTAELIETDDNGRARDPQIAFDSSGNAIAVWDQYDGTRIYIWANRFDGSAWGTPELIETDNPGPVGGRAQIAFDSNGNAIAVWYQHDGTRYNIWANRFDGSAWGSAELIEGGAENASFPQIALDSSGNAIAVWQQSDGTRDNIWANRFNGSAWGSAELIETNDTGRARNPQIAFDSSGNAIAVWRQDDGVRDNIWANRFNGSSWGSAALIEADNAGDGWSPQIAFDSSGNAIAVWHQSDGTRDNIWANRFE